MLRSVEFIYKSTGVNRPLRANEDHPRDNLNKTYYRDQINKVANAVKEIITAIKKHSRHPEEEAKEDLRNRFGNKKDISAKLIIGSAIALALIILSIFLVPKLIKSKEQLQKSIAVLPFHNYSDDSGQEYMSDGLTDEIFNHLYKIRSFDKVVSLSSVLTYKGTDKKLPQIADELKVNYILEGTYKKIGDQVRVTAQLIEPKNDKHLWQNEYDQPYMEIIAIQADIALQIANQIKAYITTSEQQYIQKIPTTNQEAFELLQKAEYILYTDTTTFAGRYSNQSLDLAVRAIELDPYYADAYALAGMYILGGANYGGGSEMSSAGWDALHLKTVVRKYPG